MRFKCSICGAIFTDREATLKTIEEPRGEYWGIPCSETMTYIYCPECGAEEEWFEDAEDLEDEEE